MSAMKSKTGATILLIATFLLGGIAGAVTHRLIEKPATASSAKTKGRQSPQEIVGEMARGLKLDGQQEEKLAEIIRDSRDQYRALSKQFQPQYQALRHETNEKIRAILTEQQKAAFEEQLKEVDARNKSRNRD